MQQVRREAHATVSLSRRAIAPSRDGLNRSLEGWYSRQQACQRISRGRFTDRATEKAQGISAPSPRRPCPAWRTERVGNQWESEFSSVVKVRLARRSQGAGTIAPRHREHHCTTDCAACHDKTVTVFGADWALNYVRSWTASRRFRRSVW